MAIAKTRKCLYCVIDHIQEVSLMHMYVLPENKKGSGAPKPCGLQKVFYSACVCVDTSKAYCKLWNATCNKLTPSQQGVSNACIDISTGLFFCYRHEHEYHKQQDVNNRAYLFICF